MRYFANSAEKRISRAIYLYLSFPSFPQYHWSQQGTSNSQRWTTALPASLGTLPTGWWKATASCMSKPRGSRPMRWANSEVYLKQNIYQTIFKKTKCVIKIWICVYRWMLARWRPMFLKTWPPWQSTQLVSLPSTMKEKLKLWLRASRQVGPKLYSPSLNTIFSNKRRPFSSVQSVVNKDFCCFCRDRPRPAGSDE